MLINEIKKWASQELPPWQSDIVRTLLTTGSFSPSDFEEILTIVKIEDGLLDKSKLIRPTRPVDKQIVPRVQEIQQSIFLKAISNIKKVNALPLNSEIKFGHKGLTVVYGENAAGKSGYARIFKRACNARDYDELIQPNIFSAEDLEPASATFVLGKEKQSETCISWTDDGNKDTELSLIHMFDSRCARIILDEKNGAVYLPYGAEIFEQLVQVLEEIKKRLLADKENLNSLNIADVKPLTTSGQWLSKINHQTTDEDIKRMTTWSDKHELSLSSISQRLTNIDPVGIQYKQIRLNNIKQRCQMLLQKIQNISQILSVDGVASINETLKKLNAAEQAMHLVSIEMFKQEPVSGGGTSEWQLLYNTAKDYSLKIAYPSAQFPNIEEQSRCVLCMQPLSPEAKERFKRFHAFMDQRVKQEYKTQNDKLIQTISQLSSLPINYSDFNDVTSEVKIRKQLDVTPVLISINEFVAKMINFCKKKEPSLGEIELAEISKIIPETISAIEIEISTLMKDAKPEEIIKLQKNQDELVSQRALSFNRDKIFFHIHSLKRNNQIDLCSAKIDTRGITSKAKSLIASNLTPALLLAIQEELKLLGLRHLPVNIQTIGSKGETMHKLELKGKIVQKSIKLTEVLSEGEQRVVAIGSFLAEIGVSGRSNPIVFDDPVSSLDHLYREKIADRLAFESAKRQVILFTHDIAFLSLLWSKSILYKVPFTSVTVYKEEQPGINRDGLPWHASKVTERIDKMNKQLASFKGQFNTDRIQYNKHAAYLYCLLRESWEAAVEEHLLNNTISRYSGEVQTIRLLGVEVTDFMVETIYHNMSKCSKWMTGHDKSTALDANRPDPTEIASDIEALRKFVAQIKKQQEAISKKRKNDLEKPITCERG
ncbi:MAG: hypothetical protein PHV30_10470 [Candidatus Margulisbacteria bacterium]|nr:hypothetical protein [Candidatus Margulisiibacteriota bacterium]